MTINGNIVDVKNRQIYSGEILVKDGHIQLIRATEFNSGPYILPGFIDAHVHIESSMLVPSEFARLAVVHGTVATVSDPHEIANVCGIKGVEYMIENGKKVPFKFYFGAPSCVPATSFETAGATIDAQQVDQLLQRDDIHYLSEMMNFPGVLSKDPEVIKKIAAAKKYNKPVDGHAPGLKGKAAIQYIQAGMSTDHECFSFEEAKEKLEAGMKIIIREGSAAKNYDALIDLLEEYPNNILFCSDDKHPDDLVNGHINQFVIRSIARGFDLFDVLHAACIAPIEHYNLNVGCLQEGDPADFIIVNDLAQLKVLATYINGVLVAENGVSLIQRVPIDLINNFDIQQKKVEEFQIPALGKTIQVIKAIDGELITEQFQTDALVLNEFAIADPSRDILKIAVINRYQERSPALGFINGFGIKDGAIASCVGHDSHNILAIGDNDKSICRAVNLVIKNSGGISAVSKENEMTLPLPVGGLMSTDDGYEVGMTYQQLNQFVKESMKSSLTAPFMTLSFMALLVIPNLKLSDQGLFDGKSFEFVPLFT